MSLKRRFLRTEGQLDDLEDIGLSVFLGVILVLAFGVFPFVHLHGLAGHVVSLGFTGVFLAGGLIGDLGRRWRRTVLLLAAAGAILGWLPVTSTPGFWRELYLGLSIIFSFLICLALLRQVFRPGEINWHRFRGAIAVYVLLGFLFALAFVLLEDLAPGSFAGFDSQVRDHQIRDAVYFSFVTLTTVGYVDITPISEGARSFAIVEAILGQIFLAVLIGRLVTLSGISDKNH